MRAPLRFLLVPLLLLAASIVHADSLQVATDTTARPDTASITTISPNWPFGPLHWEQRSDAWTRTAAVVGASLGFSLVDYLGYNTVRRDNKAPMWYRGLQAML